MLHDEQKTTTVGFLARAVYWFNGQGVECLQLMSNSGPSYVSRNIAKACKPLAISKYGPDPNCSQQREGRAVDQDPVPGMGKLNAFPEL